MLEYFKPAIHWLHFHPFFACATTFLIAFSESIALIGLFIPGSLLLVGIGTLIGSGVISPLETILSAIFGALLGDFVSFWAGHHYSKRIHVIWPFRRWPKLLDKGIAFFHRHGGKGIFLGRFVGPIRPITPIVAGIMRMPLLTFFIVDTFSAVLWAIAYMLPGIILGSAASAELSSEAVPHFILSIVIAIISVALLYWVIEKFIRFLAYLYHRILKSLWVYIQNTPSLTLIKQMVRTPLASEREHQLDLFLLLLFSACFFTFTTYEVLSHGWLTHDNAALNYFFRSLRTITVDKVMIPITCLGEKRPMGAMVLAVGAGLIFFRYFRAAYYWFLNAFFIFGLAGFFKYFLHIHRPLGTKGALAHGWSYPSGHVSLSIAILGLLVILLAQHFPRLVRRYLYGLVFGLVAAIAVSRLYLGVHWLTDVLGGFFLGLACLAFTALWYRHKKSHIKTKHVTALFLFAFFVWLGSWGMLLLKEGHAAYEQYQLSWPKSTILTQAWWEQSGENNPPLYRSNRFGKPIQTLNIQLMGDVKKLKAKLLQEEWFALDETALKILFYKLSEQKDSTAKLPFITELYLGQAPVLAMYKTLDHDRLLILRLWHSGIEILPDKKILIAGEINYHHTWHPHLLHKHRALTHTGLEQPLDILIDDLQHAPTAMHLRSADFKQYPPLNETADKDWSGSVLLIKN